MTIDVCARFGAAPSRPSSSDEVGIALQTLHLLPLNALRHAPADGTCGWYIWAGDLSNDPEFFSALHVEHLQAHLPKLIPYLDLPPGWRVQLAPGLEDVWFDEGIRNVRG